MAFYSVSLYLYTEIEVILYKLKNIFEAVSKKDVEKISNVRPNEIVKVYHGTPLFRLPDLINGFDATIDKKRDYTSRRHPGIFVTLDFNLAKSFGGGAIIEIDTPAKFIHGTNYNGQFGREQIKNNISTKKDLEYLGQKYKNSFRPYMSYTMVQNGEPQGLLIGIVSPKQIPYVWIRNLETKKWDKYSRKEYLKLNKVYNVDMARREQRFLDAGIDLSDPHISLSDFISAYLKAHNLKKTENDFIKSINFYLSLENGEDRVHNLLASMSIGGSKLGEKAINNLLKQIKNKNIKAESADINTLLSYLFENIDDTRTKTILDKVKNNPDKYKNKMFWISTNGLSRYIDQTSNISKSNETTNLGFDSGKPIKVIIGKNNASVVDRRRFNTAIKFGIPFVPVRFYFNYTNKSTRL